MCMCCHSRFYNKSPLYFNKYVCFTCRVVNGSQYYDYDGTKTCYKCNTIMKNVGMKFAPPPKNKVKQWNYLKNNWKNSDFS